jgi:hypothetical protein
MSRARHAACPPVRGPASPKKKRLAGAAASGIAKRIVGAAASGVAKRPVGVAASGAAKRTAGAVALPTAKRTVGVAASGVAKRIVGAAALATAKRTVGVAALALVLVLSLSSPLWAGETLMSLSGFESWIAQKLAPREQGLDRIDARAGDLERRLADWEHHNLSLVSLWPDDTRVEYFAPGGVPEGVGSLDVPPKIIDGRTMVPLRFVGETLGAEVIWNGDTRQVAYIAGSRQLLLTVGQTDALVNGRPEKIDTAPQIINDRTMVPVRFVGQWLGAVVRWDDAQKRVDIGWLKGGTG